MNLSQKLLSIFFINLIFFHQSNAQIGIVQFTDNSTYKGSWNLKIDIPNFIAEYLRTKYDLVIYSPKIIENDITNLSNQHLSIEEFLLTKNINFLIKGTIKTFSINRLIAGEPKLAQYETYSNTIEIEIEIIDLRNRKIIFDEIIEQKSSDLGVGVTIFGRESEAKQEFQKLNLLKFGSDEFLKTLVGKNLLKFCESLSLKLEKPLNLNQKISDSEPGKNKNEVNFSKKIIQGEILFVDHETKEVFVNLGRKNNVDIGTILYVFAIGDTIKDSTTGEILGVTDKKIGEIEIVDVRGDHFSMGIIKKEDFKIQKGNKIRRVLISSD